MNKPSNIATIIGSVLGIAAGIFMFCVFSSMGIIKHSMYFFVMPIGVCVASIIPIIRIIRTNSVENKEVVVEELGENINFEGIYTELQDKHAYELDKIRKRVFPAIILVTISVIGLILMGFWVDKVDKNPMLIYGKENMLIIVPIIIVTPFFAAIFMLSSRKGAYTRKYKDLLVADLISRVNGALKYERYNGEINRKLIGLYGDANFDKLKYNRWDAEDVIHGNITNALHLEIAELSVDHESGSRKNRTTINIFKGIFACVERKDSFKATIKVLNNKNKMSVNNSDNLSEVKMDSTEFENMFNVYSDNPVVAMRVLTSDIMEKIIEYEKRLNIHYELLISTNGIYMRLFTKELFEPSIFNKDKEKKNMRMYYEILNLVIDMSKELDKIISEVEV